MSDTKSTEFERTTCSRCGGSGHYSYCQGYGTKCFKCHGSGKALTKRGSIAYTHFLDSLKVRLDSLKVGDLMQIDDVILGRIYFAPIVEIKPSGSKYLNKTTGEWESLGMDYVTNHKKYGKSGLTAQGNYMVRKGWDGPTKTAKRAEALSYQDTLTQAGTVRKGKAA